MNLITRLLITLALFIAMVEVSWLLVSSFGFRQGDWQYETLLFITVFSAVFVWKSMAPKRRPPPWLESD